MYYVLYITPTGFRHWELVDGEDAMQQYVDEIVSSNSVDSIDDVIVLPADAEIK